MLTTTETVTRTEDTDPTLFASLTPWETYAHKIIAGLCLAAWREANTTSTSKRRKKHQPYSAPEMAQKLTAALGLHDATERERTVKALLLEHNYRVSVGARE